MIEVSGLDKTFTLHNQSQAKIPVIQGAGFAVAPGECVALTSVSGSGKSTLMRIIYGNYLASRGEVWVDGVPVHEADPRAILQLRRTSLGYVSQFLRVVPRVPTLDVVSEPMLAAGIDSGVARERSRDLLTQLRIPEHLWSLSPLTFSGGEQQRVNIARGFAYPYKALLVDEPTASLDGANRETVLCLIKEATARGAAILGIFHDEAGRNAVCSREINVSEFKAA